MANKHAEALCAMMDGELERSEARFLIKRLSQEPRLVARWSRYHVGRAMIRGELSGEAVCLCERISNVIANEPAPMIDPVGSNQFLPAWLRPVAGFAVAASVAVAAFTLLQTEQSTPAVDQSNRSASVTAPESLPGMALRAQPASAGSAAYNPRLQAYVMRHNAVSLPSRGRDLVPYMYLVVPPVNETEDQDESGVESQDDAATQPAY